MSRLLDRRIGYKSISIGDHWEILVPKKNFRGRTNNDVIQTCPDRSSYLKFGYLNTKVGYKSVCVGDMSHILLPNWGFSGSATLIVSLKLVPDRSFMPRYRKLSHFVTKF